MLLSEGKVRLRPCGCQNTEVPRGYGGTAFALALACPAVAQEHKVVIALLSEVREVSAFARTMILVLPFELRRDSLRFGAGLPSPAVAQKHGAVLMAFERRLVDTVAKNSNRG